MRTAPRFAVAGSAQRALRSSTVGRLGAISFQPAAVAGGSRATTRAAVLVRVAPALPPFAPVRFAPVPFDGEPSASGAASASPWVVFSQNDGADSICQNALIAAIDIITQ